LIASGEVTEIDNVTFRIDSSNWQRCNTQCRAFVAGMRQTSAALSQYGAGAGAGAGTTGV
jgi:hypothetical protein